MRFTYQANGQEVLYNLLDDLLLTTEASAIKRIYLDPGEWPLTQYLQITGMKTLVNTMEPLPIRLTSMKMYSGHI